MRFGTCRTLSSSHDLSTGSKDEPSLIECNGTELLLANSVTGRNCIIFVIVKYFMWKPSHGNVFINAHISFTHKRYIAFEQFNCSIIS